MAEEAATPILTEGPLIHFKLDGVDPPSTVYVARDDLFRVTVTERTTTFDVHVLFRLLLPNGEIIPNAFIVRPTTPLVPFALNINLAEGFLLSVGVSCTPGSPAQGDVFCQVELQRFLGGQTLQGLMLIAGYISGSQDLAWPSTPPVNSFQGLGNIRQVQGTDPAAGAEITEVVPTGALWRLLSVSFQLVTDATPATRTVRLQLGTAIVTVALIPATSNQTASLTVRYTFGDGLEHFTSGTDTCAPSVRGILLPAGSQFATSTLNLQAGDNFGAPHYEVEEWLTVP